MNTKTLLGAPLGLALGLAAIQPATAQSADSDPAGSNSTGIYAGAAIGIHFFDEDDAVDLNDAGGSIDAQLGYRLNDNLRLEAELGINAVGVENSDDALAVTRLTAGLYYDFQSSDNVIVPYIGGGLGIAGVNVVDDDDEDGSDDAEAEFTFHADAGVSVNVNPYIALVPSYRYTWTDDSNDVTDDNVESHAVRLGLRVSF